MMFMTPWVLILITLNALVHLVLMVQPDLGNYLALQPRYLPYMPWTAITYMFVHAPGITHILFNMVGLYFFGPPVEARIGGRRFLTLYLIAGISGAILSVLTSPAPIVGASGAVFGVMLGFAWFWPRQEILIWGILPIEARWLIVMMTVGQLVLLRSGDNIAHFAHLGGFAGAWIYLKYLSRKPAMAQASWRKKTAPRITKSGDSMDRWRKINASALHPVNREEYERVIAKIDSLGTGSLTHSEREFLDRFSQAAG
ncbi:MAG TPA: rhomboid family intramembrane serine protease [Gemmatimonadales bacterium]|jgi:membrane associated rhomboid family serine protease